MVKNIVTNNFIRRGIVQFFPWPVVENVLDFLYLFFIDIGKIHFFREILPNKSIGVFVESSFPWGIRVSKKNLTF